MAKCHAAYQGSYLVSLLDKTKNLNGVYIIVKDTSVFKIKKLNNGSDMIIVKGAHIQCDVFLGIG